MPPKGPPDDAGREIVRDLWKAGHSSPAIAESFGITRNTVMGIVARSHLLRCQKEPSTLLDRMDALDRQMDAVLRQYPPGTGSFPLKPQRRAPGEPPKPAWFLGMQKNAGRRRAG